MPRSGVLSQLVVFDFGNFQIIRGLAVHVLTEHEIKLLDESVLSRKKIKPKPYVTIAVYIGGTGGVHLHTCMKMCTYICIHVHVYAHTV